MKKPKLHNNPLAWVEPQRAELKGVRLSDVQQISTARLKANALNAVFFREESGDYFEKLRGDVEERGIIVPLIAKPDETLLAGHNRLRVAQDLGLPTVPVQYVLDALPEEAEREFIIKDNLYRRHFSTAEWIGLYKELYPNFDEQILRETRGGGQKWNKTEDSVLLEERSSRLTAEKIASDTGQKLSAVQKQLTKYRNDIKSKTGKNNQGLTSNEGWSESEEFNEELAEETAATLTALEKKLKGESRETVRFALAKVSALKSRLEKMATE